MNAGLLGKAKSVADSWVLVYVVGTDVKFSTVDIHSANTSDSDSKLSIAVTTDSSNNIDVEDYLTANTTVQTGGMFGMSVQPLSPGEKVYFKAEGTGVSCSVRGYEETNAVVDTTSPT